MVLLNQKKKVTEKRIEEWHIPVFLRDNCSVMLCTVYSIDSQVSKTKSVKDGKERHKIIISIYV